MSAHSPQPSTTGSIGSQSGINRGICASRPTEPPTHLITDQQFGGIQ